MNRLCGLIISLSVYCLAIANNVTTNYSKGTYHTSKSAVADADFNSCSRIIDDFIFQLQTNPEQLFTWAFKGLGQTHKDDGSDDIVMTINNVSYDADSAKSVLNVNLAMSNGLVLRNRELKSYVNDKNYGDSLRVIAVDFYYSGSLLKKADGTFRLLALNDRQTEIDLDINIRFGWFFNIFITQRRYRNVMEWRIDKFVENIVESSK